MEGPWLISYLVLWALTVLLVLVVLAHSRLLGLLHHRIRPSAARPMADGPTLGTPFTRLAGSRLDGTSWTCEFPNTGGMILVFMSPQCQTCNELMPHVKDFVRANAGDNLILVSLLEDPLMNQAYVRFQRLEKVPYIIAPRLAIEMSVEGTPYAISLSRDGVVTAKGLVNNYEHLTSLCAIVAEQPSPA